MTHLPFILAAYGVTIAVVLWLGVDAITRAARAKKRLAALEPRQKR